MRRLDRHHTIALDMDLTLTGAENSLRLRAYVKHHLHDKHFYIITFRDEAWAAQIPFELANCGMDAGCFRDILYCPAPLIAAATLYHDAPRLDARELHERAKTEGLRLEDLERMNTEHAEWKGKAAAEHGCTLLVDDAPLMVRQGCEKYHVELLDTAELMLT